MEGHGQHQALRQRNDLEQVRHLSPAHEDPEGLSGGVTDLFGPLHDARDRGGAAQGMEREGRRGRWHQSYW